MWALFKTALIHFQKVSLTRKFLTLFILGILFLCFDFVMGYSYNKSIKNQVAEFEQLQRIIENPKTDSISRVYTIDKQREVLQKTRYQTYFSYFFLYLKSSFFHSKTESPIVSNNNNKIINTKIKSILPVNLVSVHFLTTNWFLLIVILVVISLPFSSQKISFKKLFASIFLSFILLLLCINVSFITSLIPTLYSKYLNYILNTIIGTSFPLLIVFSIGVFSTIIEHFLNKNNVTMPSDSESIIEYIERLKQSRSRN